MQMVLSQEQKLMSSPSSAGFSFIFLSPRKASWDIMGYIGKGYLPFGVYCTLWLLQFFSFICVVWKCSTSFESEH